VFYFLSWKLLMAALPDEPEGTAIGEKPESAGGRRRAGAGAGRAAEQFLVGASVVLDLEGLRLERLNLRGQRVEVLVVSHFISPFVSAASGFPSPLIDIFLPDPTLDWKRKSLTHR
jgi:hypothetical protein